MLVEVIEYARFEYNYFCGENEMTICWLPSLWHSVTPPLKNPGYAPDSGIAGFFGQEGYPPPSRAPSPKVSVRVCVQLDKQTS